MFVLASVTPLKRSSSVEDLESGLAFKLRGWCISVMASCTVQLQDAVVFLHVSLEYML